MIGSAGGGSRRADDSAYATSLDATALLGTLAFQ